MDLASLFGILSGLGLIITAISIGGNIGSFINGPGLMIVFGGTIAATLLTFPFRDVMSAFRAAFYVFLEKRIDPNDVVTTMIRLTNLSRRKGLVELCRIKSESGFLLKAANLIADGSTEEEIRRSLQIEIQTLKSRHHQVQDIFKKMGTYSPAFGMLGTLVGLVKMLSRLQDPSNIGPAMAVALLTTFYGSLLATMLFLPVAGKLRSRTQAEIINMDIMFEGGLSILENNNPIIVYEKLSSYISVKKRRPMEKKIGAGYE